jgi:fatty acid desaturase (delta-4 desaturase)
MVIMSAFALKDLHNFPNLVAIDDNVYDINRFSKVHPGGNIIEMFGGTDATVAYYTIHPKFSRKKVHSALDPYKVGVLEGEGTCAKYVFDSAFATDVIKAVYEELYKKKAFMSFVRVRYSMICALYMTLYLASMFNWIASPSWRGACALGVTSALINLNIGHDGSHGVFAGNKYGNLLSKAMQHVMDLTGAPAAMWYQQHIMRHHPFTNDYACDKDLSSAEPALFFYPSNKKLGFHRWQHIFAPLILHTYGFVVAFDVLGNFSFRKYHDQPVNMLKIDFVKKHRMLWYGLHVLSHMCYLILPWFRAGWSMSFIPLFYLLYSVESLILTLLFSLSHNFQGALRIDSSIHKEATNTLDWYRAQVESSCTYGGVISGLLTGGLNYQIEHHLFPRMPSCQYPYIQDTIRTVCAKHGIKYTYFSTAWSNLRSTFTFLRNVGNA